MIIVSGWPRPRTDAPVGPGVLWIRDGEMVEAYAVLIGSFSLDVLHVPGHTPGGCVLLFGEHCLCGDVLFAGSIGRSDLPGGDGDQLVAGIQQKLMVLPDNTIVYPGHGGRTTIGRERRNNPFLT